MVKFVGLLVLVERLHLHLGNRDVHPEFLQPHRLDRLGHPNRHLVLKALDLHRRQSLAAWISRLRQELARLLHVVGNLRPAGVSAAVRRRQRVDRRIDAEGHVPGQRVAIDRVRQCQPHLRVVQRGPLHVQEKVEGAERRIHPHVERDMGPVAGHLLHRQPVRRVQLARPVNELLDLGLLDREEFNPIQARGCRVPVKGILDDDDPRIGHPLRQRKGAVADKVAGPRPHRALLVHPPKFLDRLAAHRKPGGVGGERRKVRRGLLQRNLQRVRVKGPQRRPGKSP